VVTGTDWYFFFTLVAGPRRSLSLKLSDTRVYVRAARSPHRLCRVWHGLKRADGAHVLSPPACGHSLDAKKQSPVALGCPLPHSHLRKYMIHCKMRQRHLLHKCVNIMCIIKLCSDFRCPKAINQKKRKLNSETTASPELALMALCCAAHLNPEP